MDGSRSRLSKVYSLANSVRSQARERNSKRNRLANVRRRRLSASIETLESRHLLTFAIDLFADINEIGRSSNAGVDTRVDQLVDVAVLNGEMFFAADDGANGAELWKTDGTEPGTVLVKDILAGPDGSAPFDLTIKDNELFFMAEDENGELDLWKTDGTEAGTVVAFDAQLANDVFVDIQPQLTQSGDKLFFVGYDSNFNYELWASDGTQAGTQLVYDFGYGIPFELTDVNGTLFFSAYDSHQATDSGYELWKSDGTTGGTMMVADLGVDPGLDGTLGTADDDPSLSSNPTELTELDGVLYFVAEDAQAGYELFRTDGTEAGTMIVDDITPGSSSYPEELTPFGSELFFSAVAVTGERHLFKSDGSTISQVADTTNGTGSTNPLDLEVVGNELFFSAHGVVPATTISATSPTLTADNSLAVGGSFAGVFAEIESAFRGQLTVFGNVVNVSTTTQGSADSSGEPPGWVSSSARIGTANVGLTTIATGDLYVEDIDDGDLADDFWEWTIADPAGLNNISFSGFASGNEFEEPGEGLLFELFLNGALATSQSISGNELDNWVTPRDANNVSLSDPGGAAVTSATVRLSIDNATFPNLPSGGTEAFLVNATLTADLNSATTLLQDAGRELHKTDGTTVGTGMVKDIVPIGSSGPSQLTSLGNQLLFVADDVTGDGEELWVSDGTEGGTLRVFDTRPGTDLYGAPLDGLPRILGELDGEMLFTSLDANADRELWISNGTEFGTSLLKNINPFTEDAGVDELIVAGSDIFFAADDGIHGEAIWKADTQLGTVEMVADVSPSSVDQVSGLTLFSDESQEVVFYNNTGGMDGGVYITDGSNAPIQLFDRMPQPIDDEGNLFAVAGNRIFFVANDGTTGNELWWSDGASVATLVSDMIPGSQGSDPTGLVPFQGSLYFAATSDSTSAFGDIGRELFVLNPSNLVIQLSNDLNAGSGSSSPEQFTLSGNNLFFVADNGVDGRELFNRNFTSAFQVADLNTAGDSNPSDLTNINNILYFTADDGTSGREPYRSRGVQANTFQIADINPGSGSSDASGYFEALGEIYFAADNGTIGSELYRTTGAAGNFTLVEDVLSGPLGSDPIPLLTTPTRLFFSAAGTTTDDQELWITNGTTTTVQVDDLNRGENVGSYPRELVEVNGSIYFSADNGINGRELFVIGELPVTVSDVLIGGEPGAPEETSQRSVVDLVTVVFDGPVDVPAAAISVRNTSQGIDLTSVQVNSRYEFGQTFVELTFASGPSVVDRDILGTSGLGNSLATGYYQLTIDSSQVTSLSSGQGMPADFVFGNDPVDGFFRLLGDATGDGTVNAADLRIFGSSLNTTSGSSGYRSGMDFDGDGDVDNADLSQFRRQLLRR
ncbi:ELWxxDGT repeat protein [Roseiconus lacunae]|uniref:ELWxxDGT repeat protein n=1 Tax=Roseiconus lacunae TaxID=2605694 RepID=UPI001E305257|nr:ELWxxDGT repeat protein [Roseiconus lacunae]MCD0458569.1 dockerin type I domain-containing protein [Roseiconus lacunae]